MQEAFIRIFVTEAVEGHEYGRPAQIAYAVRRRQEPPRRRKVLKLQALGMAALLGLAACGGGGDQSGPPKVQPVADVQESNILIHVRVGYGSASWVLLQYDGQKQL